MVEGRQIAEEIGQSRQPGGKGLGIQSKFDCRYMGTRYAPRKDEPAVVPHAGGAAKVPGYIAPDATALRGSSDSTSPACSASRRSSRRSASSTGSCGGRTAAWRISPCMTSTSFMRGR
jgi:hypothetical protein